MTPAVQAAVAAVSSRVCWCGGKKGIGTALCTICWRKLSVELQRAAYPHRRALSAKGYADACGYLEFREGRRAATCGGKGG